MQAPRQRTGGGKSAAGGDRRLLLLALFAASGIAMLVIVVGFLLLSGGDGGSGDDTKVRDAFVSAGCTFETKPARPYKPGQTHVPDGTKVTWNTFPPAAGSHYGTPAVWGFYTEPVDPRNVVHNEEHGGVVLWWGPQTPQAQVDELRRFYDEDEVSMFGTPIKGLGSKVAITAWTGDPDRYGSDENYYGEAHVGTCPAFNEDAFKTFRDEYRGKGPEGIAMELNQPGQ